MKCILIVEDIAETRDWLGQIARAAFPCASVIHAGSIRAAIEQSNRQSPDLALVDLGLPDGSGVEVVRHITCISPRTICVVTTVMGNDASIVSALSAGAGGYLLKEKSAERLTRQLSQIAEGVPALSPSVARRIMDHFRRTGPVSEDAALTVREREVLAFVSRGLRNQEVAQQLGVSETTIATHLKSIYRKLGISSRAEASWFATRMGLAP